MLRHALDMTALTLPRRLRHNPRRHRPGTRMLIDEEITLKKLETFLAFMRTGNLARAAELGTSNVSVHRAIHSLESALRCPLFKHEGRNLTPLESAYVLEERAQKLVQEVLDTVRLTREAAGFSAERFKLGALYSLTVKTVPQLIMGLKLRRSALNIDLILGSNVDLFYQLKNMELDAILVSLNDSVSDPDCEHLPLFSDDIFLAVPVDSPYARLAEIDLSTLRDTPFVTLTQGFATHQDGTRVFQQAGFEPQIAMQVNDIFTLLSMVSSGSATLLPKRIEAVYENRVRLIPLQPRYRLQQHIGVVFLKARSATRTCWRCSRSAGCTACAWSRRRRDSGRKSTLPLARCPLPNPRPSGEGARPARSPNQAAHAEIQQRRPQQATDGGIERRGQATVGHQLRVGGGEAAGDAAGGAHETTEDHRRTWIVQADVGRDERRQDHHQDRLHQPGGDAQRHHLGTGPRAAPVTGPTM